MGSENRRTIPIGPAAPFPAMGQVQYLVEQLFRKDDPDGKNHDCG